MVIKRQKTKKVLTVVGQITLATAMALPMASTAFAKVGMSSQMATATTATLSPTVVAAESAINGINSATLKGIIPTIDVKKVSSGLSNAVAQDKNDIVEKSINSLTKVVQDNKDAQTSDQKERLGAALKGLMLIAQMPDFPVVALNEEKKVAPGYEQEVLNKLKSANMDDQSVLTYYAAIRALLYGQGSSQLGTFDGATAKTLGQLFGMTSAKVAAGINTIVGFKSAVKTTYSGRFMSSKGAEDDAKIIKSILDEVIAGCGEKS